MRATILITAVLLAAAHASVSDTPAETLQPIAAVAAKHNLYRRQDVQTEIPESKAVSVLNSPLLDPAPPISAPGPGGDLPADLPPSPPVEPNAVVVAPMAPVEALALTTALSNPLVSPEFSFTPLPPLDGLNSQPLSATPQSLEASLPTSDVDSSANPPPVAEDDSNLDSSDPDPAVTDDLAPPSVEVPPEPASETAVVDLADPEVTSAAPVVEPTNDPLADLGPATITTAAAAAAANIITPLPSDSTSLLPPPIELTSGGEQPPAAPASSSDRAEPATITPTPDSPVDSATDDPDDADPKASTRSRITIIETLTSTHGTSRITRTRTATASAAEKTADESGATVAHKVTAGSAVVLGIMLTLWQF
ncbi:hypothetical protein IWQ60_010044 [Tieghemiomyces parasiticus]|uniref:Uncharacterized protein n=1 Tax=Tieghemiomyces parasiticus TaxID=78921 RepID=A0A9W7ZML9_9FUNG|nr:hypothetical protein IWQ60_010044 [Tieghemiomyces parasiticus]